MSITETVKNNFLECKFPDNEKEKVMQSRRLTISIKDQMVKLILSKALDKKEEELKVKKSEFALECYNYRYNDAERKAMLEFEDYERVFNCNDGITCHFDGRYAHMALPSALPFHSKDKESSCNFAFDHPLTIKWKKLNDAKFDLNSERKKLGYEIRSVLNGLTTTKRLLEEWPECSVWLEQVIGKEPAPVPMKNPDKLNAILCDMLGKGSPTCKEVLTAYENPTKSK